MQFSILSKSVIMVDKTKLLENRIIGLTDEEFCSNKFHFQ